MMTLPIPYSDPITVSASVRDDWSLADAVTKAYPGNLLPSRVAWFAALHSERLTSLLDGMATIGLRPIQVEIVRTAKFDRTTRPAADMPIEDQILFFALTDLFRGRIPEGMVTFTVSDDAPQTHEDFERFPLTEESVRYVLEVDVAGFYQNISHELLAHQLIGLTGRADATEPLTRLLEGWMGSSRGLPQGPVASYLLADIYISPAARALSRAGFRYSRYSDDFRVLASDWPELKQAQQVLEEAFYGLGLSAAPGKLRTPGIQKYADAVERVNDPRLAIPVVRDTMDELEAEDYVPTARIAPTVTSEEVARAEEVLMDLIDGRVDVVATRLIRRVLPRLGGGHSSRALNVLPALLSKYAHLTPTTSAYMKFLMRGPHEDEAIAGIVAALRSPRYLSGWQIGWLLSAANQAEVRSPEMADIAQAAFRSHQLPWFARGQAALAIALHGTLPRPTEFVDVYEMSPKATRPDLVAAVVLGEPPWRRQFVAGVSDAPLLAEVVDFDVDTRTEWL